MTSELTIAYNSNDPAHSKILVDGIPIGWIQKMIIDLGGTKIFFPDYEVEGATITNQNTWQQIIEAAHKISQCAKVQVYLVDFSGNERPFPLKSFIPLKAT